ncbi:neurexin-3 [Limosa lapponica baueri]|uniref:Neurexin-3 n=1 Tax=Limosa lapponica baueri TaxID=1758121 RepID=A0A2I0U0S2_LIMLA|nr:neurexin-3 [Limosa lapponica baueri]
MVSDLLCLFDTYKSMGLDGIHLRVLRELVEVLTKPLSTIYQQLWLTREVPVDKRLANVTPVYRKVFEIIFTPAPLWEDGVDVESHHVCTQNSQTLSPVTWAVKNFCHNVVGVVICGDHMASSLFGPPSFEDIGVLADLEDCVANCRHEEVARVSRKVLQAREEKILETMGFTLHSIYFTLKVSLLLGSLLGLCLGLEFMGIPNQWARYLRWDASTRSELSFQFKTNVSAGLLLYFDDGGVCDFLCLSLVDGRIQLQFSVDCAETTVITDKQVNDSNWHFLMVSRNHLRTVLVLDGEAKPGEVRPQRQYMNIVSDLFVGGVPLDIRPAALTLDGVLSEPPFQGFILDLKYGNSEPQLLGSQGVRLEMEGLCAENPCENGGTCFLLDGEPHCDCSATGYVGKLCSEDDHEATILFCLIADQLQPSGNRQVTAHS